MNLITNLKYSSISQLVKISTQILGLLFFAKYLTPNDFGLVAISTVIINFVNIIREIGTSAAIIHKEKLNESLKNTLFWTNLVIGLLLFILVWLLSPFFALFFNNDNLKLLIPIIAISLPISNLSSVSQALLERECQFKNVAKIEVFSSIISLILSVIAAINNFGPYSIAIQILVYSSLSSIGFIAKSQFKPTLKFEMNDLKSIFNFSANIIGFNFVNYFSRNLDQIMIGKFYSVNVLGNYSLAYRIMLFPLQSITSVLSRSLFPILSRIRNNKEESSYQYLRVLYIIVIIVPPTMMIISYLSSDILSVFFNDKWELVPIILLWLTPTAILQSIVSTTGTVFISYGRPSVLFKISIFNCLIQSSSFVIGIHYDIITLVQLYLCANIIMFIPNMYIAFKLASVTFINFINTIRWPVFSSMIMIISMLLLSNLENYLNINKFIVILLKLSIPLLVYIFSILILDSKKIKSAFSL
ncbi:TPA: lipopolysaccharide biosynthesis protein [Providencia rettgeri]|uniref:lipopolysaccharide biosynthesis protein n=1 Tax=Providencia sp. VP23HZSY-1 TaxID=3391806 RepID=UPI0024ABC3E4|nr:lipopolysaccharide biosynthesis protein [Providencia rettgeri]ELQ1457762.1 lipopolysaccharide biosynthesis protein [Providencia rettgeri]ELR5187727.1 lipopolysaccharide biosynthesis protein [Providencia rettgeri]EMB0752235.1 lipopolysaccharide biosynthesis protein [Providencia rettgeri]HEM7509412.1 lipopolysaccharide biosynthesis protein [Providencia rettgeri]